MTSRTATRALLLCAQPALATSVVYCLRGMGAAVVAAGTPTMRFLRYSRYCEKFVDCAIMDADRAALGRQIDEICDEYRIDVIVPGDYDGQVLLAEIGDELGAAVFPTPSEETFRLLNDKWQFYEICRDLDLPVPDSVHFDDKSQINADELGTELGYPLVVKPTGQGGANGVVVAESPVDLSRLLLDAPDYHYSPLIAQRFIPGGDYGLNIIAVEGKIERVAVQMRSGDDVTFLHQEGFVSSVRKLVETVKFTGAANFDARVDAHDGCAVLLECNPRLWATICHAYWCGSNFVAAGVERALNRPVTPAPDVASKTVRSPAHLLAAVAKMEPPVWRLTPAERRSIKQGLGDPVLLLRRFLQRRI